MNPARAILKLSIIVKEVSKDYEMPTQASTHWDGIADLAERPIASRGVLLDWANYAAEKSISYNAVDSFEIPYTDLQIIADSHDIKFQEGDILRLRSGYQLHRRRHLCEDDNFGKQFFKIDNVQNISPGEIKTKSVPTGPAMMRDVVSIVRSKASGPFELTFDIVCDDDNHYQRVKRASLLTNETIKKLH
ncbi:hypothetical protein CGCSCA4_v012672 [Colletotrichum siamense]|uniref:DUF4387 domain-containing protein n=1 Tax=Colletotrichum siamense TaxID=690259 RepID=A0A9P5BUB2_COLSI|nr:hypothetical protein CGCSCA4_v012672 [Colletotrichum siamense]KAF4848348.1 hypothetical protein CGCSCA2_v012376 [Colletotrichum siamense]